MEKTLAWVEEHPALAAVLGIGGLFIILWLLGFFSSSSQNSGNSGQSNLAAAYYAAEAAQTTAGTQLNITQANDNAQVAIATQQANAATAIASTQADMYTTINGQNVGSANTINAQDVALGATQSNNQLLATQSNNEAAIAETNSNNYYANQNIIAAGQATAYTDYVNTVLPQELAAYGTAGFNTNVGGQTFGTSILANPAMAASVGYTPAEIQGMFGVGAQG